MVGEVATAATAYPAVAAVAVGPGEGPRQVDEEGQPGPVGAAAEAVRTLLAPS